MKNNEIEWIDIPNWPYQINKIGQIRRKLDNKIIKLYSTSGYPSVELCRDGEKKLFFLHRLLAETFIPKLDDQRTIVAHNNGNRKDYRLKNLRWATYKENSADTIKHRNEQCNKRQESKAQIEQKDTLMIDLIDIKQASKYLGLSASKIRGLVANKELVYYRLGHRLLRFKQVDLDAWLEKQKQDVK